MTVKNRRVKTKYLDYSQYSTSGGAEVHNAAVEWTLQEDITIIGWYLGAEAHDESIAAGDWYIETIAQLSRSGRFAQVGVASKPDPIDQIWALLERTADAAGNLAAGLPFVGKTVMLPAGYGIDIDAGEDLYLNCLTDTPAAMGVGDGVHIAEAIVYYVER